jgi:hypothetical protein
VSSMSVRVFATAVLGFGLAFSASAAKAPDPNSTLTEFKGKVSVNAGKEFVAAQLKMRLKPGDRVMVEDKSGATIVFDDECRLEIEANKLVTVPDDSTCKGAVLVQQGLNPGGGAAIGAGGSNGALPIILVSIFDICMYFCEDDHDTVSP